MNKWIKVVEVIIICACWFQYKTPSHPDAVFDYSSAGFYLYLLILRLLDRVRKINRLLTLSRSTFCMGLRMGLTQNTPTGRWPNSIEKKLQRNCREQKITQTKQLWNFNYSQLKLEHLQTENHSEQGTINPAYTMRRRLGRGLFYGI